MDTNLSPENSHFRAPTQSQNLIPKREPINNEQQPLNSTHPVQKTINESHPTANSLKQPQNEPVEKVSVPQSNKIFGPNQLPTMRDLPELVRLALQGSIKSLLQVSSQKVIREGGSGAQSAAPRSVDQTSASPNTIII